MADRFSEFQYIAVPEFQPISQRVHYHLFSNLRYIPNKQIAEIWNQEFIKINRIDKLTNVGAYICKYLSKEMCDERLFHKKKFFCSQELNHPTVYYNDDALTVISRVRNLEKVYETKFFSYFGEGLYMLYKSNDE